MKPISAMSDEELAIAVAEEVLDGTDRLYTGIRLENMKLYSWIINGKRIDFNPFHDANHWMIVERRMRELNHGLSIEGSRSGYEVAFYEFHGEEAVWLYPKNHEFHPEVWNTEIGRAVCEAALVAKRGNK